jgi:hypothetical protein
VRIEKIPPTPQVLMEFAAEGLQRLGALCERTWHDRLQVVADGPAAATLGRPGELVETELCFPEGTDLDPVRDVFPGCPLAFRMAEELWKQMPRVFRAALPVITGKPPPEDVLYRGWARNSAAGHHPALAQPVKPAWHFTIVALLRCEIQAIDQHWSLHQLALAWPGGESDDGLAREIAFLGDEPLPQGLSWPAPEPSAIGALIERRLRQHIDLDPIRKRQERYLGRELARVDAYFLQYRRELEARGVRGGKQARFAERLAAAEEEHLRRRNDQIHRHEISVTPHLDALLWTAEPAWRTHVRWTEGRETREAPWNYVPRLRRWLPPAEAGCD